MCCTPLGCHVQLMIFPFLLFTFICLLETSNMYCMTPSNKISTCRFEKPDLYPPVFMFICLHILQPAVCNLTSWTAGGSLWWIDWSCNSPVQTAVTVCSNVLNLVSSWIFCLNWPLLCTDTPCKLFLWLDFIIHYNDHRLWHIEKVSKYLKFEKANSNLIILSYYLDFSCHVFMPFFFIL